MQEELKETDFGIPVDSRSASEGWPSESDGNRIEAMVTRAPDQPEVVKPARSKKARGKGTQGKSRVKGDLTPLLNALAGEILETMDLLVLARGSLAVHFSKDPDQRIAVLCRRVSRSLLLMQDIGDRIAAAVGED